MQPLRYGAEGAAVADVRRVLAGLGLLANLDSATERTFDTSAELAVRHFQQRRGLSVRRTELGSVAAWRSSARLQRDNADGG